MPTPTTTANFLELVRKTGLIDVQHLEGFLREHGGADAMPPRKLAGLLVEAGLLTQFQAEQVLQGKWRGFTIGKYKVLERLGSGGMGTVYLCEHLVVRRKVAVKVLPTSQADNPSALGRFYREARAAGVLDHPNLVKAHDIDQDNGLHFLIMDYVDGASLQEIVSRFGPLSVARAAHYIRQAAEGLDHAHKAGLVHRDVKPANILLDRGGTVRILDLGLARFFTDHTDPLTLKYDEKNVLGTADYVAPEQALNSHDVDIRADVYSLGATFYFCLTGQVLFPEGKTAQKLIWHQVRQPTPVQRLRSEVPDGLAAVLTRMMAKDPAQRYQTPAEVVEALEPWTRTPVPPPPESEMPRLCLAARANDAEGGSSRVRRGGGPGSAPRPASAGTATPSKPQAQIDTDQVRVPGGPSHSATRPATPAVPAPAPQSAAPLDRVSRRRRAVSIVLAAAVIGLALRVLAARAPWATVAAPPAAATLVVARSGGPGTFATVRDALRQARPGDYILLRADTWVEDLDLTGAAGVTLEGDAPSGRPVVWRALPGHRPDRPLLAAGGAGLHLKGFTFDGEDRIEDLVTVTGSCPGLTLEDVRLVGFRRSGVVLRHWEGSAEQPVTLRRLRVAPGRPALAALDFAADATGTSRHVHVSDCRFEGPYRAAVRLSGPATGLVFEHNRIFNVTEAFLVTRSDTPAALDLTLSANTLCQVAKAGLHLEAVPLVGSRVVLTRNFFGRTGTLAQVDGFRPEAATSFLSATGNVRDAGSGEGVPSLKATVNDITLPTDAADDARFLRQPEK